MRYNVPPGTSHHASRQHRHSSTVDTRVMKPTTMARHSGRSRQPAQKSPRAYGSKPRMSPSNTRKPSGTRSSRNRSSSGNGRGRRAVSESRRRTTKSRKNDREYYSDYSDEFSNDEDFYLSSDSSVSASEGDMATQLDMDNPGVVVNASDLSECWSKVSIDTEEESAFQRFTRKVEEKERKQNGFFFSSPQEEVSLPSLDTKGHTTFSAYTDYYSRAGTSYSRADTYTEADTYTRGDTYTEADTYTRGDTFTEADTYTQADSRYPEDESTAYTRADTYTEADTQTYASTHYGRSEYDSYSDSEDSGIRGDATYYTTRTQRTEAVQGNMWMCGVGNDDDDDTLGAQSYGGLRNHEVLIASSATIATFETRDPPEHSRGRARNSRSSPRSSPRATTDQYGRKMAPKTKQSKKMSQPKKSRKLPTKTAPAKRASASMKLEKIDESQSEGSNLAILAMPLQWLYGKSLEEEKLRKREARQRKENAKRDLLVKPPVDGARGYDGSLILDARVRKDAEEAAWSNAGPPAIHLDGRIKKATQEPEVLNGKKNQPAQPVAERTPSTPPSAFAPKKTQKIAVWTDGDTEAESVVPHFSGQCKVEAFGDTQMQQHHHQQLDNPAPVDIITPPHEDDPQEVVSEAAPPAHEPFIEEEEEDRGLHEEMEDAAFDTVWVAPSAMSRMSFESHQTLPTINTIHQSVATKEKPARLDDDDNDSDKSLSSLPKKNKVEAQHERKNSSVSNLVNAFEKNLVVAPTPSEQTHIRARADWRNPGPLVAPVVPTPAWIASAHKNSGSSSSSSSDHQDEKKPDQHQNHHQQLFIMDPEQMKDQQRCLFDTDDERTEMTGGDEPSSSTMLQLDFNGQVSGRSHVDLLSSPSIDFMSPGGNKATTTRTNSPNNKNQAFDSNFPFLGTADPESVQPKFNVGRKEFETAFSTNKNNDVEHFGQFKRETLQSEPSRTEKPTTTTTATARATTSSSSFKPRRRRNGAAGKVKSFLSSFPRRNQKKNNNNTPQSYHQLDDNDDNRSFQNWGMTNGSTVASNMVHGDLGEDDHPNNNGMTTNTTKNAHQQDAIVRDAMASINGTEQLMRDADSFFAAGSFYEALEDGFSVD